jgi:glycerol transport system ATP-binding protein
LFLKPAGSSSRPLLDSLPEGHTEAPIARIELDRIAHSYRRRPRTEEDFALKSTDHVWQDGEAYALLGPSGCGKTTLLNIISGLLRPSHGRVLFDGRDVTPLAPQKRNIAQVFQFPVVYDTMTVFDNLAFPLRNRSEPESAVRPRVHEVADMLGLAPFLKRSAGGLSSDAKQKVSLGRGLVRTDVAAILFDEPLTAIDPHAKIPLRRQLREIHERRKLTLIYVTHDQTEALTFADKVAVMHEGEVVQVGTPQELFERPEHTFVGHFIGSPGMNFMSCELDGPFAVVGAHRIRLADDTLTSMHGAAGDFQLGIRPEFLRLVFDRPENGIRATVTHLEDLGSHCIATVAMGEHTLRVKIGEGDTVQTGKNWLVFPPERSLLFRSSRLVCNEA